MHSVTAATGVTIVHLLSLRCIRDQILKHMEPRAVVRLSGVNRLLRSILHAPSVDRTYWMQRLGRYATFFQFNQSCFRLFLSPTGKITDLF